MRPTSDEHFRRVTNNAGLEPTDWTPRELRHSVTEKIYRLQLRPVLLNGAIAMDSIFGPTEDQAT
jgi:hypothetical protein